jgi:peroxiredoxin
LRNPAFEEVSVLRLHRLLRWQGAILGVLAALAAPASAVDVGDQAPDFSLYDLDGQARQLTDYRGNVVILYFFGHNAGICTEFARSLQGLYDRFWSEGVEVIGIDCWDGSTEQVDRFRDASEASYPLLLAGSGAAADYDLSYNSTLVLNTRGYIRYLAPGPDASAFDPDAIESAVEAALQEGDNDREATWGVIKSIYDRSKRALLALSGR